MSKISNTMIIRRKALLIRRKTMFIRRKALLIDGKAIAKRHEEILKKRVSLLKMKPKLSVVLVGSDPARLDSSARQASKLYVSMKIKKAEEVGIETEVVDSIEKVSSDAMGIIVQLPCSNSDQLISKIPPGKDVDGLTGKSKFLPATVKGILTLLNKDDFSGEHVVIVGRSNIVGKPLALEMINRRATVTVCNSKTKNLGKFTKTADILISATGHPNLITKNMVKPGSIVIDVGSPKGDVDFENVKDIAGAITPVPGGVGPMTIVSLLENVVEVVV